MQRPTLQNIRIQSTSDAIQVFNGVANHLLPLIIRNLDAGERQNIMPGNVYVWEERATGTEEGAAMERWTDGMTWGPGQIRDGFVFYCQNGLDTGDESDDVLGPVTAWPQAKRGSRKRSACATKASADGRPSPDAEGLTKQTYSVWVSLPADRARGIIRKWHLAAYLSQPTRQELNSIDKIRGVGDVVVPEGWFRSSAEEAQMIPGRKPHSIQSIIHESTAKKTSQENTPSHVREMIDQAVQTENAGNPIEPEGHILTVKKPLLQRMKARLQLILAKLQQPTTDEGERFESSHQSSRDTGSQSSHSGGQSLFQSARNITVHGGMSIVVHAPGATSPAESGRASEV